LFLVLLGAAFGSQLACSPLAAGVAGPPSVRAQPSTTTSTTTIETRGSQLQHDCGGGRPLVEGSARRRNLRASSPRQFQ